MRLGLPGKEGRKEGSRTVARIRTLAVCLLQFEISMSAGRRWAYLVVTEANQGLISLPASCSFERHVVSRCVASRCAAPDRTGLCRAIPATSTGQLNRSKGFSIFCLSTMVATAQKWLSARNTRHYTLPYSRAPFLFLSPDPRGPVFHLPTPFGLTVCADLAHLRPT